MGMFGGFSRQWLDQVGADLGLGQEGPGLASDGAAQAALADWARNGGPFLFQTPNAGLVSGFDASTDPSAATAPAADDAGPGPDQPAMFQGGQGDDVLAGDAGNDLISAVERAVGETQQAQRLTDTALSRAFVGPPPEPATSTNRTVNWAQSHVGKGGYGLPDTARDARGIFQNILLPGLRGIRDPKCNQFVYDALTAGGAPPGRLDGGRIPVAKDWGDSRSVIAGYRPTTDAAQPGDVVSNGHHVGIYAPLADGGPGTISAATPDSPDAAYLGSVVHNDWGFRPGQSVTVWRRAPTPSPAH